MYIKKRTLFIVSIVVVLLGLVSVWAVLAASGTTDSSNPPGSTSSYTLEDIYNSLNDGTAGTQSTFTEPNVAPGTGTMHTLDDIMAVAPVADDTNGAATADVTNGKTFWGLTGGAWGLQTGTRTTASAIVPVPKTGQTTSYAAGDDGDLQKGVAWPSPRFTDNGDGTVTDNLTELVWLKNANCWGLQTWASALSLSNGLADASCGLTDGSVSGDWRLPNVRELLSLIQYGCYGPALSDTAGTGCGSGPFTGVQANYYWPSTTFEYDTSFAWYIAMGSGYMNYGDKNSSYYVWPVRGGQ